MIPLVRWSQHISEALFLVQECWRHPRPFLVSSSPRHSPGGRSFIDEEECSRPCVCHCVVPRAAAELMSGAAAFTEAWLLSRMGLGLGVWCCAQGERAHSPGVRGSRGLWMRSAGSSPLSGPPSPRPGLCGGASPVCTSLGGPCAGERVHHRYLGLRVVCGAPYPIRILTSMGAGCAPPGLLCRSR